MNNFLKNKKGITLVALVVTIIILLILAGISIATLTGSGIFEKARLAEQESKNKQQEEQSILGDYENKIAEYVDGSRDTITISKEEYEKLKNLNNYSTEEKVIGTWIDGKPLYQKTVTVNCGANGSTWYNEKHNIENIADIADYNFSIKNTNGWYFSSGFGSNVSNNYLTIGLCVIVSTTEVQIFNNQSYMYNQPIRLTVCYTKTTD